MPWDPSDAAAKTRKANTPKKKRVWSHVANSVLAETNDEGRAIRQANAVVARHHTMSARQEKAQRKRGH